MQQVGSKPFLFYFYMKILNTKNATYVSRIFGSLPLVSLIALLILVARFCICFIEINNFQSFFSGLTMNSCTQLIIQYFSSFRFSHHIAFNSCKKTIPAQFLCFTKSHFSSSGDNDLLSLTQLKLFLPKQKNATHVSRIFLTKSYPFSAPAVIPLT